MKPVVGIIMGSDSDLPVMAKTAEMLEKLDVPYEMTVISAHRTPERLTEYVKTAADRGIRVIVSGAGGAAALPGVIAAQTVLPVIGVPIRTQGLGGVDSLYSIVQMPTGIPVATVAINGAANAGLLAAKIVALGDEELTKRLVDYSEEMKDSVNRKAEKLEKVGYKQYLDEM